MHKGLLRRTTVVHIEGDRTNALLMQFVLASRHHYALHQAADCTSGLQLCQRVKPDMVITEMHLPDGTAYDVLHAMRTDMTMPGVPCVVFSGDAMPAHVDQAMDSGFDDYWVKPIDIWQLIRNIDDVETALSLAPYRSSRPPRPPVLHHRADTQNLNCKEIS